MGYRIFMNRVPPEFASLSAPDLIEKLSSMAEFLADEREAMIEHNKEINEKDGWKGYANPLEYPIQEIIHLAETSISEIQTILKETRAEVKSHHIQRLERLGETANELSRSIGITKHQGMRPLDDNDPLLHPILNLYAQARDLANSMSLLSGWGARMMDFMGSSLTSEEQPAQQAINVSAGRDVNVSHGKMDHHIKNNNKDSNLKKIILTVVGGLVVAFLVWQFGW